MNYFEHAYEMGKQAAAAQFKPVAPPTPKASLGTARPGGQSKLPSMTAQPPMPTATPTPMALPPPPPAPSAMLAGASAMQLGAMAPTQVNKLVNPLAKLSAFNFKTTPDPAPKDAIKGDNGEMRIRLKDNDGASPWGNAFKNLDATGTGSSNPDIADSGDTSQSQPWGL